MPISCRPSQRSGSMKVVITLALVLAAQNATAAELTPDQRAKLDRYIEDKTRQVCADQHKGGAYIASDDCFTNMKPLMGYEQPRPGAKQTFSSGDAIRHCGPQGCQ